MSTAKAKREKKRQLGQFLTPAPVARRLVHDLSFTQDDRVLEPSMGDGSFVLPIIEKFIGLYTGSIEQRLERVLTRNVYGVEIDENLYRRCLANIKARWGCFPARHNLILGDFFRQHFLTAETSAVMGAPGIHGIVPFTHIIGNPPFGGTFDRSIEDDLDREYGFRNGEKIKKETLLVYGCPIGFGKGPIDRSPGVSAIRVDGGRRGRSSRKFSKARGPTRHHLASHRSRPAGVR
ncbi:MAG: hypothetical protein FJ011_10120 [Chloroflexi bacterium]|nr:hypothetical protein [Chloroflexota bacterium]